MKSLPKLGLLLVFELGLQAAKVLGKGVRSFGDIWKRYQVSLSVFNPNVTWRVKSSSLLITVIFISFNFYFL